MADCTSARSSRSRASRRPRLPPGGDPAATTVDDVTVELGGEARVGERSDLHFAFTDARTGRPIDDLQPFLAAAGHVVIMRADGATFAHEHAEVEDDRGRLVLRCRDRPSTRARRARRVRRSRHLPAGASSDSPTVTSSRCPSPSRRPDHPDRHRPASAHAGRWPTSQRSSGGEMYDYDVVVIGAGQAGLATGTNWAAPPELRPDGRQIEQVGGAWPQYYDSLTLFSPARFCSLLGSPCPGDPGRYPTRDETVEYLRYYAQHFGILVRTGAAVHRVQRDAAPGWSSSWHRRGAHRPRRRRATGGYRNPTGHGSSGKPVRRQSPPSPTTAPPSRSTGQRVVAAGAGNSAVQVAHELAQVTEVTLATRSPMSLSNVGLGHRPPTTGWPGPGSTGCRWDAGAGTSVGVLDDGTYAAALVLRRPDPDGDVHRLHR